MRGENFLALLLGILEGMEMQVPKNFVAEPYDYHQEIEFEIESLTNLGMGLGRLDGWVVMVPSFPGSVCGRGFLGILAIIRKRI